MPKITRFKDFSDSKEIIEAEEGQTLRELFPNVKESSFKVFVNGVESDFSHVLKTGDLVVIRTVPHLTGAVIAIGIISIVAGVVAGVAAYKMNKDAERMRKEMEKLSRNTSDGVTNLPFLKGAQNAIATGKTQPYIIGTHLFTPYILNAGNSRASKGFHTLSGSLGEKTFWNVVLEGGFSDQVLSELHTGDLKVLSFPGTTPQNGSFRFTADSAFYSADSFAEVRQGGSQFEHSIFSKKIVEAETSLQLKKHPAEAKDDGGADDDYENLYFTLEQNARALDVCVMFNGLVRYDSNGSKKDATRTVYPAWSSDYAELLASGDSDADSHATWHTFQFSKTEHHEPVVRTVRGRWKYNGKGNYKDSYVKSHYDKFLSNGGLTFLDGDASAVSGSFALEKMERASFWERSPSGNYGYVTRPVLTFVRTEETPGWTESTMTNTFSGQHTRQIRFEAHAEIPFSEIYEQRNGVWARKNTSPVTVRLSSPDRKLSSGSAQDDCYAQWVHSYCADERLSCESGEWVDEKIIDDRTARLSTLIGLRIESTEANQDKTDSIQLVTSGVARCWDGSAWESEKKRTSNPAAWLLEVLTSPCHPASRLDDSEIDLESLGEMYELCEQKGYEVNYVIAQGMTKESVLELIFNTAHLTMYRSIYGQIAFAMDCEKPNAVAILNEQNMTSFSYTKELGRPIDGLRFTYIDAEAGYQQNSIVLMYERYKDGIDLWKHPEERPADCTLQVVSLDGITGYEQAMRHALYLMRCQKLRPKAATAAVGKEGIYYTPLSKVLLQHPSLKIGLGSAMIQSVIDNGTHITGLVLYDALTLDTENTFNVIMQCVSDTYCTPLAAQIEGFDGRTKEISFKNHIPLDAPAIPHAGDILSYGYDVETVTSPMLITAIAPSDKGYTLTLVDYDERIFADGDEIPEYEANITQPKLPASKAPSSLPPVTLDTLSEKIAQAVDEIDLNMSESPNIYAELLSCGFSVDDDGITPLAQEISTTVHIIQENEEIDFSFGVFTLPEGFTVETEYHTVKFKVAAGTRIKPGTIYIPINYRQYAHKYEYADESGEVYEDNGGNKYGVFDFVPGTQQYRLGFAYEGVKGGRYLGGCASVENLPEARSLAIGDYFTWTGATTESGLSRDGTFKTAAVYSWSGFDWVKDENSSHTSASMNEILTAANEDLARNNSKAYEYLDHLTANSIFVGKLVANTAFIENLFAKNITMQRGGIIKSQNYNGTVDEDGNITKYGNEGWAIDYNGKADFSNMEATGGTFRNINAEGGTFTNVRVLGRLRLPVYTDPLLAEEGEIYLLDRTYKG